jgi:formamidase
VHVKGAKFSVGDLHFSQGNIVLLTNCIRSFELTSYLGDGEISFCGAIEMAGTITLKFSVMKGGIKQLDMKSPIYIPGPVEPQFGPGRYIYFEGFSVDEHGKQHYLDTTIAYRQTCLRVIEYLRRFGETLRIEKLLCMLLTTW